MELNYELQGREVVEGDFMILNERDRIAADCNITASANLTVESNLYPASTEQKPAHEIGDLS